MDFHRFAAVNDGDLGKQRLATSKDSFRKANQSNRIQEDINRERSAELNDSALCPYTTLLSSIYMYDTEIHKYYEKYLININLWGLETVSPKMSQLSLYSDVHK